MGTPDEEPPEAGGRAVGRAGARYPSAHARHRPDDVEQAEQAVEPDPEQEVRQPQPGDPDYVPDASDIVHGGAGFHYAKSRKKKKKKAKPEPAAVETPPEPEPREPEPLPEVPAPPMHEPHFPARRSERVFAAPPERVTSEDIVDEGLRVRPYVLTRGRTQARSDLNIETLISTDPRAQWDDPTLSTEYVAVRRMCVQPRSVAEIAALMSVPLGVARVLLSDLADEGFVQVHTSKVPQGGRPDYDLMQRVLDGLHRL